jgi:hypothetical protein
VIYTTVESHIAEDVQPAPPTRVIRGLFATSRTAWLVAVWKPCGFTDLDLFVRDDTATGGSGLDVAGEFLTCG